jgi:hypothetical protein
VSLPGLIPGLGAVVASGSGSGGGGGSVVISDQTLIQAGLGSQTIGYRANTSGVIERNRNAVYNTLETWRLSGSSSDYEIRATQTSGGTVSGSALSSWLGLGTSREWTVTETLSGASTDAELTVEIRIAAPPNTVLDSASISLSAIVF